MPQVVYKMKNYFDIKDKVALITGASSHMLVKVQN